ncbi:hypothetical protein D3C87_1705510 [compost metagenome]
MISTSDGTDSMMSMRRMISASKRPPITPEKQPSKPPIKHEEKATNRPTPTDCWLPNKTRLNRSRPTSSVPNQCSADGAAKRSARFSAFGSWLASQGAKIMHSNTIKVIARPAIVSGLRRIW